MRPYNYVHQQVHISQTQVTHVGPGTGCIDLLPDDMIDRFRYANCFIVRIKMHLELEH